MRKVSMILATIGVLVFAYSLVAQQNFTPKRAVAESGC
jgi:hypothetical protein